MNKQSRYELIIKPPGWKLAINMRDIWHYRELAYVFVWRDIKVRYKQTLVGILWAIFQPLFMMIIFSILFSKFVNIKSYNVPYPIFVFSGLIFWNYFITSINSASNSLLEHEDIIKKVYFPRLLLPLSATITPLVDFLISCGVFFAFMWYFNYSPYLLGVILMMPLIIIAFLGTSGIGIFLAAVNVKYRDVRYILPFFTSILLFFTPVIYPINTVEGSMRWILAINPITGVIEILRATLFEVASINFEVIAISFLSSIIIFLVGIIYFSSTEYYFADVI